MTFWVSKIFSQWKVVKELYTALYYQFLKCILEDIKILNLWQTAQLVFPNYDGGREHPGSKDSDAHDIIFFVPNNFWESYLEPVGLSAQMGRSLPPQFSSGRCTKELTKRSHENILTLTRRRRFWVLSRFGNRPLPQQKNPIHGWMHKLYKDLLNIGLQLLSWIFTFTVFRYMRECLISSRDRLVGDSLLSFPNVHDFPSLISCVSVIQQVAGITSL